MVVQLMPLFVDQLEKCPTKFKEPFRKIYEQLKIVDHPLETKGIKTSSGNKQFFKIMVENSRIGLKYDNKKAVIICFLYNEFVE
jgi:mRNA-degrading endonuclease RelE of RelBE toxin-antitoxin system